MIGRAVQRWRKIQVDRMKKTLTLFAFASGGAAYLAAFSPLDVHFLLKYTLVMMPIQAGLLVYFLWWKPRENYVDRS